MRTLAVILAALGACFTAACTGGLTNPFDGGSPPPAAANTGAFYTSIAYAPASRPCCAPAATPAPTPQRPSRVRPGEVWCYVKVLGEVRTREERRQICAGHWEWQRSPTCEVPGNGTAPAAGQQPQVRREIASGIRPGEVWCSHWIPPTYATRTLEDRVSCDRWEWRRTPDCDVPTPARTPAPAPAQP